jgi:hypothetical protein
VSILTTLTLPRFRIPTPPEFLALLEELLDDRLFLLWRIDSRTVTSATDAGSIARRALWFVGIQSGVDAAAIAL